MNSEIKHKAVLLLAAIFPALLTAQTTTLINPAGDGGFESGNSFALNGWTVVNTSPNQPNQWFCGSGATGFTGTRCAHVGTASNNNTYNFSSGSVAHFYRDISFPAGQSNITLTFNWKGYGESWYDYLRVFLVPTSTAINAGTQLWSGQIGSDYNLQTNWQNATITLPCSTAGTTMRLVFSWINDYSIGTNPAAAVDNISLISSANTQPCATLLGTGLTTVASLPYNSGSGTTCGSVNDIIAANTISCGDPYYLAGEDKVWAFTPASSGQVSILLTSTGTYTSLTLYAGCPVGCSSGAACVGFVQDYSGTKGFCVSVTAGTTYNLVLDSYYGCNAYSNLSISAPTAIPPGTTCANSVNISSLPFIANGETTACFTNDYTNSTPGSCGSWYESGEDKVYKYVASGTECIGISVTNASTTSTGFQVYQGCPGAGGVCLMNKGGSSTLSGSVVLPSAGSYYIIVDSWAPPSFVNYNISITSFGSGPSNDLPCNATPLSLSVSTPGDNSCSGGTGEPASASCWYNGPVNSVWYSVVCPASGQLRIQTQTGSLTTTQIAVYSGSCNSLTLIPNGCNIFSTSGCSGSQNSEVFLTGLTAGATYFISVDGYWDLVGSFTILAIDGTISAPPTVQDCDGAIGVCQTTISTSQSYFGCGNNNEISTCPTVSNPCTNVNSSNAGCLLSFTAELHSVWYLINITTNGSLRWTCTPTNGGFYDWSLFNITNSSCAAIKNNQLAPVRCNWNATSTSPTGMENPIPPGGVAGNFEAPLNVTAGQVYVLILSNYSGTSGGYTLTFANSTAGIGNPPTVTWTGATNTSWNTSNNWGACAPPVCGINANIAPASNQPVITTNQTVKDITIMPGATLTLNAGVTLTVCGNFSNYGALNISPTSTILFNNAAVNQNINGAITGTNKTGHLTVTKTGGSVTLNTDIDMAGNFTTSNNTSVFNSNGKYIKLAGNFNNSAGGTTFMNAGATGTLEFNGIAGQNYSPGGLLTLNNVVMNHTGAGVTVLGSNMILGTSGNLTLNAGKIITNALEVVVNNTSPSAVTPGNTTSFVQGNLRRFLSGSVASYDFPVGHSLKGYQRANITFTTSTTIPTLLANFNTYSGLPNGAVASECPNYNYSTLPVLDNGYWNFTASANPTSGNYNMTLYNANYTNSGTYHTVLKSATSPPTAGSWALSGTCNAGSTAAQTIRNAMNGFSSFGTGVGINPLPIELIYFNAERVENYVLIKWTTATELNNDYFLVEKSKDGIEFESIGRVEGAGNSNTIINYYFDDHSPYYGINYYRLKQVDYDGKFSYSPVAAVEFNHKHKNLVIYPNPANEKIFIQNYLLRPGLIKIEITDASGRIVFAQNKLLKEKEKIIKISITSLEVGSYQLRIIDEQNQLQFGRFVK